MEVLKKGNGRSTISMEVTCTVCGSFLRIEPKDLDQMLGSDEYSYICPCCLCRNLVSSQQNKMSTNMELALKSISKPLNLEIDKEQINRTLSFLK